MTYDELVDFIENRMTMSHVYQPVLIRSLVDAGGKATLRQLAQAFLVQDESQLLYLSRFRHDARRPDQIADSGRP